MDQITSQIDTRGEGFPVVVFNTLGWPRTDAAETDVDLAEGGLAGLALVDSAGQPVPLQFTDVSRYADGGIKHAHFAFLARDIPALGFATYHVILRTSGLTERRRLSPETPRRRSKIRVRLKMSFTAPLLTSGPAK